MYNPQEKNLCLKCRHFNDAQADLCEICGAELFKFPAQPPKSDQAYREIEEKTGQFKYGSLSATDYWNYLVKQQIFYEKHLQEIESMELPAEHRSEFVQEMQTGTNGIRHLIEGIKLLQEYCEKKSQENLSHQGLSMAKTGNELLNQAIAINWVNFHAIKKSFEEFLTEYNL